MCKYKILNVRQLIHQNLVIMAYKIDKSLMKCNHRINVQPVHHYATRNRLQPRLIPIRTNIGKKSIFRYCTELYLTVQQNIWTERSIHVFKKKVKQSIIELNELNESNA